MSAASDWLSWLFSSASASEAWQTLFARLAELATAVPTPAALQKQIALGDRLLAECAWELWSAYAHENDFPRTSRALQAWWHTPSTWGKAALILDAFSVQELPALLAGAKARSVENVTVQVTGSEVPSETDQFAQALGVPSRSSLANNHAPGGFVLDRDHTYTDVFNLPFEDCVISIPNEKQLVIWHSWLDDQIHVYHKSPNHIAQLATKTLQRDGFWAFVDRLRQGRELIITSDHGYAVSKRFTNEQDSAAIEALRNVFGASRCKPAAESWSHVFMPPLVVTTNKHHVVIGPRKWKVQGGFPHLCHGGLSLCEVAVPYVKLPAL